MWSLAREAGTINRRRVARVQPPTAPEPLRDQGRSLPPARRGVWQPIPSPGLLPLRADRRAPRARDGVGADRAPPAAGTGLGGEVRLGPPGRPLRLATA